MYFEAVKVQDKIGVKSAWSKFTPLQLQLHIYSEDRLLQNRVEKSLQFVDFFTFPFVPKNSNDISTIRYFDINFSARYIDFFLSDLSKLRYFDMLKDSIRYPTL